MMKVSALVSAYFAENYLDQRLTNLYGQGADLQIIVVAQKGSKEETIASRYNLDLVLTPTIPPIGEAWNLAIEHATGDYLTTANVDDRYHIGGLEYMTEILDQHPEIGLVFSQVDIDDGLNIYPWKRFDRKEGEVEDIKEQLKSRCQIGPFPLWRRSIHEQIGYFDETYTVACDYDMWLRMANAGVRFYYLPDSAGIYRLRSDSLEHRNPAACKMESKQIRRAQCGQE